jgi:glycosyltransferase involved in cell wall biosynthesis
MKPPKVSIIIPSYNKGKYIKETLQSIVDQNYSNLEVIVQDGGSTDGSVNVIKSYSEKYDFFKWESKKDKGQVDAINKGLKKATGDLLTYINADDVYEKNALISVVRVYIKHPKALWFAGRGKVIDKSGKEIAKLITIYKNFLLKYNSYNLLLTINYLMQPSVFLTQKAYIKYGSFVGQRGTVMEYDLWLNLGKVQMPILVEGVLSKFRLIKSGISMSEVDKVMAKDYEIARKHTDNQLIIFLHKFHNFGRKILSKIY